MRFFNALKSDVRKIWLIFSTFGFLLLCCFWYCANQRSVSENKLWISMNFIYSFVHTRKSEKNVCCLIFNKLYGKALFKWMFFSLFVHIKHRNVTFFCWKSDLFCMSFSLWIYEEKHVHFVPSFVLNISSIILWYADLYRR